MKVRDVMTINAVGCAPSTNLGCAVEMLWQRDCGILPIVDEKGKVCGVVTDRDICIALGTRNRLPGEVTVSEVAPNTPVALCKAEDDIHEALDIMAKNQVRRLPVVDKQGMLCGIISMDDVVVHAEISNTGKPCELTTDEVIRALKCVYGPKFPIIRQKVAVMAA